MTLRAAGGLVSSLSRRRQWHGTHPAHRARRRTVFRQYQLSLAGRVQARLMRRLDRPWRPPRALAFGSGAAAGAVVSLLEPEAEAAPDRGLRRFENHLETPLTRVRTNHSFES